jgi:lipid II:glycine glycyltransferase (peptidoglycan interpeptide bridge formation enzyme)
MPLLTEDRKEEYIKFLQTNPKGHFLQSPEWARVKTEWKNEVVLSLDKDGKIKGSMSLLIRPFKNITSMMYSPRGPVCDPHDKETFDDLIAQAKEVAKKYHSFILVLDPDIPSSDEEFKNIAKEAGFKISEDAKDFSQMIQPRYVFRLNVKDKTEEELMASFHEKWRYNIRLAGRKGVEVVEGNRDDIAKFHEIMLTTGVRDNFLIRPLEYFEKMYDELAPKGYMKLLMAKYNGEIIAAVIPIIYGNKVWYLYGASSNEYRNVMPNYLLQWAQIKLALENHCDIYDFRGVSGHVDEGHPQYGIYKFKKGFNGDFVEFCGELSMVLNPFMNFIYNTFVKRIRAVKIRANQKKEDKEFEKRENESKESKE